MRGKRTSHQRNHQQWWQWQSLVAGGNAGDYDSDYEHVSDVNENEDDDGYGEKKERMRRWSSYLSLS